MVDARLNAPLDTILAGMRPHLDPDTYVFVSVSAVPENLDGCFAIIREPQAVTLVLTESERVRLQLPGTFRCRRIDPGLDTALDALGVMAAICTAFAARGIAVNPIAAARRDHFFVPAARADEALTVLNEIAQSARTRCHRPADNRSTHAS